MKRLLALGFMVAATAVAIAPPDSASATGGVNIKMGPDTPLGWHCASCDAKGNCTDCHWDPEPVSVPVE